MGKLKIILIIVVVAAALAAGGFYFFEKSALGSSSDKGTSAEEMVNMSIDTDVITTNLASSGNFAIVQFNILLSSEKAKQETEKRKAEVRAAVISTVAGFTKDQLVGKEGIVKLEKELSLKLGEIVQKGKVERVLVTEYKIQ